MLRAFKVELDPTNKQRTALVRHAGAARWAFNWGLRQKQEARAKGEKYPTAVDLHRELNALKLVPKEAGGVPWMYDVSKCAPQEALRNLDAAFKHFFRRCKEGAARKGFPRFKSRKRGVGSFTLTGSIHVGEFGIQLPRLGVTRFKERGYAPLGARVLRAVVSERAGRWFVSVLMEQPAQPVIAPGLEVLGVDVGVRVLAVLSDGTVFENPHALPRMERKLKHLGRAVSRKVKGSINRRKTVQKLAVVHYRISCGRSDAIHKATTVIAKRAGVVVIERLNVAGMMKNHCLAGAVGDAGMAEFHRCLKYKVPRLGGTVLEAGRWFPSSKTCSACGVVKATLGLGERTFRCEACGMVKDRDVNAACNLKGLAASSAVDACGGDARPVRGRSRRAAPVKQEPNAAVAGG